MDEVNDKLGLKMNHTNAQDHIGPAERNGGTTKELIRVHHCRCGHNATPKQMKMALAEHNAEKLNVFPAKNGTSEHCSLETIIIGNTMDYNEH